MFKQLFLGIKNHLKKQKSINLKYQQDLSQLQNEIRSIDLNLPIKKQLASINRSFEDLQLRIETAIEKEIQSKEALEYLKKIIQDTKLNLENLAIAIDELGGTAFATLRARIRREPKANELYLKLGEVRWDLSLKEQLEALESDFEKARSSIGDKEILKTIDFIYEFLLKKSKSFQSLESIVSLIDPLKNIEDVENIVSGIESNFSYSNSYVVSILGKPFLEDNEVVPTSLERLYRLGSYLVLQNTKASSGCLLSPQEEETIRYLLLIDECDVGKKEGLDIAYQSLEQVKALETQVAVDESMTYPGVELVKAYTSSKVQEVIKNEFVYPTSTLTRLNISSSGELNQQVHQSRYLKSVIGDEFIYNYQDSSDPHGDLVSLKLRAMDRNTILRGFFETIVERLVLDLRKDINSKLFDPKEKLYNNLCLFFDYHRISLDLVWRTSQGGGVEITEFGVFTLLQLQGYLQIDKSYINLKKQLQELEISSMSLNEIEQRIAKSKDSDEISRLKKCYESIKEMKSPRLRPPDPTVRERLV